MTTLLAVMTTLLAVTKFETFGETLALDYWIFYFSDFCVGYVCDGGDTYI